MTVVEKELPTPILVLGCGGFIGSHLLDRLLGALDVDVIGWDIDGSKILNHITRPNFVFRKADTASEINRDLLRSDAEKAEFVINLVAVCNPSQYNTAPLRTIYSNFIDGYHIVELVSGLHKPYLHFSTSEVYGKTIASFTSEQLYERDDLFVFDADQSPMVLGPIAAQRWTYACAKQLYERLIYAYHKERDLQFGIIRPFNFFGPRMDYLPGIEGDGTPRVLACFLSNLLRGQPLDLVDGGFARRTVTSIHDAIDAVIAILRRPSAFNHFYNIGNPDNEVSICELAQRICRAFATVSGDERYLHHPVREVPSVNFYGEGYEDSDRRMLSIEKEKQLLGWAPKIALDDILLETVQHYYKMYGESRPAGSASRIMSLPMASGDSSSRRTAGRRAS